MKGRLIKTLDEVVRKDILICGVTENMVFVFFFLKTPEKMVSNRVE